MVFYIHYWTVVQELKEESLVHPLLFRECWGFSRVWRSWNMKLTTYLHLMLRLSMRGAVPLLSHICFHSLDKEHFTSFLSKFHQLQTSGNVFSTQQSVWAWHLVIFTYVNHQKVNTSKESASDTRSWKPRYCCGWKYSGVISPLLELNICCVSGTNVSLGLLIIYREIVSLPIVLYCFGCVWCRSNKCVTGLLYIYVTHLNSLGTPHHAKKYWHFYSLKVLHHCHICKCLHTSNLSYMMCRYIYCRS